MSQSAKPQSKKEGKMKIRAFPVSHHVDGVRVVRVSSSLLCSH